MSKDVKGRVLDKRYDPAKPSEAGAQLGRAEDEFQLLVEQHDGEQAWVSVAENDYHAAKVGEPFHGGKHRRPGGFRGLHSSPAMGDPATGAGQGWAAANLQGK